MHPKISPRSKRLPAGILAIVVSSAFVSALESATEPRISQITPPEIDRFDSPWSVDMDGDGDLDLFWGNEGFQGINSVWIENLGNRMFAEPQVFRFDLPAYISRFGDLNGDGRVDALQLMYDQASGTVTRHASLSGQTLTETSRVNLGVTVDEFQLVELHGDARVEIVSLGPGQSGSQILTIGNLMENGCIGILAGPYEVPGDADIFNANAVDADGDGDLDLHVGAWILERTGPQTFAPVLHAATTSALGSEAEWADLDGDGLQDVYKYDDVSFRWAKNSGAFSFSEQTPFAIKESLLNVEEIPESPAVLTFSESVTNGEMTEWHIRKVLTSGVVLSDTLLDSTSWPMSVDEERTTLAWDLDGDGAIEVVRAARVQPDVSTQTDLNRTWLFISWGDPLGFDIPVPLVEAPLCLRISSAVADLDGDGDKDFVVGPDVFGRFAMWLNDGHGHFSKKRFLDELLPEEFEAVGVRIESIESGDVDADGDSDLLVTLIRSQLWQSPHYVSYFALNSNNGTFAIPSFPVGTFDFIVGGSPDGTLYDWDGDGDLDVVGSGGWKENVGGILSQSVTPLLSSATVYDALGLPVNVGSYRLGDLDGDGRPDIISEVFNATYGLYGAVETTSVGIGFSDEFGGIEEVAEVPIQIYGNDALGLPISGCGTDIIDVNRDGHNDLVYSHVTGFDALGLPLVSSFWKRNPGNGSRLVSNWLTLPLGMSLPITEAGDFNGDGVADYADGANFLTPRPTGPLISPTYDFMGEVFWSKPTVNHVVDLDGDGDEDLIASSYNGEVYLVRNLIIDERSAIASMMRDGGVLGYVANPDEDADGDGRSNALEVLEGTDPLLQDAVDPEWTKPSMVFEGPAVSIRYRNRADAAELDLSYRLECSENLVDWIPMNQTGAVHQPLSGGWQDTVITDEQMPARAFYRVRMRHAIPAKE